MARFLRCIGEPTRLRMLKLLAEALSNLSPDKSKVFREAYRVLKPNGRLVVSDIVSVGTIPDEIRDDLDAWARCIEPHREESSLPGILVQNAGGK